MVYFKIGSVFLGWWLGVACKSFKACLLQDCITLHSFRIWGK
ncbi:hypothetical protein [Helicobacter pylori]|nr:hypothetical protein [Helicobacter pylori]